jgi:hypothetical protein
VLNPVYTLPAPLIGTVVGLLAGAYPALRAACRRRAWSRSPRVPWARWPCRR